MCRSSPPLDPRRAAAPRLRGPSFTRNYPLLFYFHPLNLVYPLTSRPQVRGPKALDIIERGLKVKEYELKKANFSQLGHFGFGISEHIDLGVKCVIRAQWTRSARALPWPAGAAGPAAALPRTRPAPRAPRRPRSTAAAARPRPLLRRYDPSTGIFGMDFYVVLGRPGFRVARRKHATARVGASHRISKDEAHKWFIEKFEGTLV